MLHIIPMPNKIVTESGEYKLAKTATYKSAFNGVWLADLIAVAAKLGFNLTEVSDNADINFVLGNLTGEEYSLVITSGGIIATCGSEKTAQYASVTLSQMLMQCGDKLPLVNITDKPRYDYRGFMLDVGRFYYTLEEIKQFIDIMCLHKLNVFHWHITEDQGWRIEIKRYPKLTEKGQSRSATNFIPKSESGFYTQDEVREIVQYCHDRNITVIPEIDMPGHMVAAIACYPELSCFERNLPVATHFGVKHDVLCVGKESSYEFIYNVLDEVLDMFPDECIHLGGDEVFKGRWEKCEHCCKVKDELGLKDFDELQAHFMNVINAYVKSKGRRCMMWNEHKITGMIDSDIAWQLWGVDAKMAELLQNDTSSVRGMLSSCSDQNYLDFTYKMNPLKGAYCNQQEFHNQLGIEAALWTEYVPNMKKAYFQTFPRLGAIAENAWTEKENLNYETYLERLDDYYKMLRMMGIYNMAEAKDYSPSKIRAILKQKWFDRRVFHWQGVHNIFDDNICAMLDKKKYMKKLNNKDNK